MSAEMLPFNERIAFQELAKDPARNIERLNAALGKSKDQFHDYLVRGYSSATPPDDDGQIAGGSGGNSISPDRTTEHLENVSTKRNLVNPTVRREFIGTCVHPSGMVFDVHEVVYPTGVLVGFPSGDIDLTPAIPRILPPATTLCTGADTVEKPLQSTKGSSVTASLRGPGTPPHVQPSALALRRAMRFAQRSNGRHLKPTDPGRTGYTPPGTPMLHPTVNLEALPSGHGQRTDPLYVARADPVPGVAGEAAKRPYSGNPKHRRKTPNTGRAKKKAKPRDTGISDEAQEQLMQASIKNAKMKLKAVEARTAVSDGWMDEQRIGDMMRDGWTAIGQLRVEVTEALGSAVNAG